MGTIEKYFELKKDIPELLFIKMGAFYEAFGPDAILAGEVLGLGTVHRNKVPMTGFSFHRLPHFEDIMDRKGVKYRVMEEVHQ